MVIRRVALSLAGNAIQYAEIVTNHSSGTATFNVQATNPGGSVIFSSQWNMTLPAGTVGVYTPSTVPTNRQPECTGIVPRYV